MPPVPIIAQRFPDVVIPLIDKAFHSISIIVFDWRWYPTISGSSVSVFNNAIARSVSRGVSVRALVNSETLIDRLASVGIKARKLHLKRMLHTKMMLIDDIHLIIGSHNYTHHGFSLNEEASIYVILDSVDNDFKSYFNALWGL